MVRRSLVPAVLLSCAVALPGCVRETGFAGEGETCVRSVECSAGLACVAGMCTSDLSLLEGGMVPLGMDAGPRVDAGAPPMMDSGGPPPPVDAGPRDSGSPPPRDAGRDSGPPPPVDAGSPPEEDAGSPPEETDGGSEM